MDIVVNDFVQVLRDHRVRVSPAESIDALRALEQTGLGEREVVRDTLRSTLVKSGEDTATFDRLFDLFFSGMRGREVLAVMIRPDSRPGGAMLGMFWCCRRERCDACQALSLIMPAVPAAGAARPSPK